MPWNPALAQRAQVLRDSLGEAALADFSQAVRLESHRRMAAFSAGVQQYAACPRANHRQPVVQVVAPAVWTRGTTRLLDYGLEDTSIKDTSIEDTMPVLVIPSLINRYHILDLKAGYSFLGGMRRGGLRPFVVDWGEPGRDEAGFGLDDYIMGRLEPILDHICSQTRTPAVGVLGYCMGGLLATALIIRQPQRVRALGLLATPWNFHESSAPGQASTQALLTALLPQLNSLIESLGELPVDVLQAMFTSLDLWRTIKGFQRFSRMTAGSPEADTFVALEDWLNNGVPLVRRVARECLNGWYAENTPYNREWRVDGAVMDPATIAAPTLMAIPRKDYIVPPGSALALHEAIPHARMMSLSTGHIGMVMGRRAGTDLCEPLSDWFRQNF